MHRRTILRLHALRLTGLLLLTAPGLAAAQGAGSDQLVHDEAHVLAGGTVVRLEHQLERYADSTGIQLAVVTVRGLHGRAVAQFADSVKNALGVGSRTTQRGILYLIAPAEHRQTIRTGRGLEAELPDALCFRILNQTAPSMGKDMEQAILNRVAGIQQRLAEAAAAEAARPTTAAAQSEPDEVDGGQPQAGIILLLVGAAICLVVRVVQSRRKKEARMQAKIERIGSNFFGGVSDNPYRQRAVNSTPTGQRSAGTQPQVEQSKGTSDIVFWSAAGASSDDDERKKSSWADSYSTPSADTSSTDDFNYGGDTDAGGGGGDGSW